MIVEDEALIGWDLADAFQETGFRTAGPFVSCAGAFHFLDGQTPDLAILDAVLSDGSCLELALELQRRGVPLIIYSGEAADGHAPELNGVCRVEKPSPVETVVDAAAGLLGGTGSLASKTSARIG